jgi:hypothetical protein
MPADPEFSLHLDSFGRLVLTEADGRRWVGVEPVRAFPISEPARWIALCDAEGHEITFLDDLTSLAEPSRQLLEQELARREFVPRVRRIVRISSDVSPSTWDVETDRGPTHFTLDSDDSVRQLDAEKVLITDARGMRYLVPDLHALDPASRRLLERYL